MLHLAGWTGKEEIVEWQKRAHVQTTRMKSPFVWWQMHTLDSFPDINLQDPCHSTAEEIASRGDLEIFPRKDCTGEGMNERREKLAESWVSFLLSFEAKSLEVIENLMND